MCVCAICHMLNSPNEMIILNFQLPHSLPPPSPPLSRLPTLHSPRLPCCLSSLPTSCNQWLQPLSQARLELWHSVLVLPNSVAAAISEASFSSSNKKKRGGGGRKRKKEKKSGMKRLMCRSFSRHHHNISSGGSAGQDSLDVNRIDLQGEMKCKITQIPLRRTALPRVARCACPR